MLKKILNTFFTRTLATIIMFVVVIINTNTFGAEGTGTIALFVLGLTLLQVLSNFVGGSTLVYLIPKKNNFQLLFLSYAWTIFSNTIGTLLLYTLNLIPREFTAQLFAMSFIYALYFIHVNLMQGKEDIKIFNRYQLTQVLLLIITLAMSLVVCKVLKLKAQVDVYIYAYMASYLFPTIASCFYVLKRIGRPCFEGMGTLLKEMIKLGFWTQIANLTQLLTYRFNYYVVKNYMGKNSLGVFDVGTKLSEAVWIFPKSICLVQYARIANQNEDNYAKTLTITLLKMVFVFSMLAILALWLLPASWIAWIFGPDFIHSKPVINSLLPGIVFLSCMSILSHHFSGYGKYWINAVSSFLGLLTTILLGFLWLPTMAEKGTTAGLQAAGWISSTAYFVSLIFTLICFFKYTQVKWREFLITRYDCSLLINWLKEHLHAYVEKRKSENT